MSALNCFIAPHAVHLVTDSLASNPHGATARFATKVLTMPHLAAAVGLSGKAHLMSVLTGLIYPEASSLEELMLHSEVADIAAWVTAEGGRCVVAGITEDGPVGWHLTGGTWVRMQRGEAYLSPIVPFSPPRDTDAKAFQASLIDLAERQRALGPIGGALVITTIRRGTTTQGVLHRWPDRIGDVVGPALHGLLPTAMG